MSKIVHHHRSSHFSHHFPLFFGDLLRPGHLQWLPAPNVDRTASSARPLLSLQAPRWPRHRRAPSPAERWALPWRPKSTDWEKQIVSAKGFLMFFVVSMCCDAVMVQDGPKTVHVEPWLGRKWFGVFRFQQTTGDITRKSQTVAQDVVLMEFYRQLWVSIYYQTQMRLTHVKIIM